MSKTLSKKIIEDKRNGLSDKEIGNRHKVNLKFIEKTITENFGINVSNILSKKSQIKKFLPKNFDIEKTSVWSFKSRGNWATHNGNYRGNWSPYIPRNIISRYSKEEDLVLDYFCGAGTTAVECKLLNRNFMGIDINPQAIKLAKDNIDFGENNGSYFDSDIKFIVGDARNLGFVNDGSIDLICAHPPYSNIINYTHNNPDDLSNYKVEGFLEEIVKVAKESYRILKDEKYCAILIGDMRKNKNVIPLGFWTIEKYIEAGFKIEELIIKRQHNCKTTGFWYTNSIKYNFLLLGHEYLVVLKKSKNNVSDEKFYHKKTLTSLSSTMIDKKIELESKTVWIFDNKNWLKNTISNLVKRYSEGDYFIGSSGQKVNQLVDLIIFCNNEDLISSIDKFKNKLKSNGILAIICKDRRVSNGLLFPTALEIEKELNKCNDFKIKEIVVISIENGDMAEDLRNLKISHKYVLIYKKS